MTPRKGRKFGKQYSQIINSRHYPVRVLPDPAIAEQRIKERFLSLAFSHS